MVYRERPIQALKVHIAEHAGHFKRSIPCSKCIIPQDQIYETKRYLL